jgi:hypothetical protein
MFVTVDLVTVVATITSPQTCRVDLIDPPRPSLKETGVVTKPNTGELFEEGVEIHPPNTIAQRQSNLLYFIVLSFEVFVQCTPHFML